MDTVVRLFSLRHERMQTSLNTVIQGANRLYMKLFTRPVTHLETIETIATRDIANNHPHPCLKSMIKSHSFPLFFTVLEQARRGN